MNTHSHLFASIPHLKLHVMLLFVLTRGQCEYAVATVDPFQDKFLFGDRVTFFPGIVKHDVRGHVYERRRKLWHEDLKHFFCVPSQLHIIVT